MVKVRTGGPGNEHQEEFELKTYYVEIPCAIEPPRGFPPEPPMVKTKVYEIKAIDPEDAVLAALDWHDSRHGGVPAPPLPSALEVTVREKDGVWTHRVPYFIKYVEHLISKMSR